MSEFDNNNTFNNEPDNKEPMYTQPVKNEETSHSQQTQNPYSEAGYQQSRQYDSSYQQASYEAYQQRRQKKSVRGVRAIRRIGAAVAFGLIAGITMLGVNAVGSHFIPSTGSTQHIETTTGTDSKNDNSSTSSTATDVSAVVNKVMPAVVSITSTIESTNYWGMSSESEGAGSGFIIAQTKDKLMIATNNHVVADSKSLTVGFIDGETVSANIVGTDSTGDLAVISVNVKDIKDTTLSQIKVATLGDSSKMNVGDTVIAIGNALGYGQSVTTGVLSAKDREVSFTDGTMTLLQTDAAINPGNSGGVLINTKGEVIGINNAKLADTEVEGMGYAIPISTAQETLEDIMNNGSIKESDLAYLGVVGRTIDSTYSDALGIPAGAYVTQVVKDSPAEEAGINAGDVITKIDDTAITSMEGLKSKLNLKKAGTKVKITVKRANQNGEYKEKELTVTLGKRGDYADATTSTTEEEQQNNQYNQQNPGDNNSDYYNNSGNGNAEDFFQQFFGQ